MKNNQFSNYAQVFGALGSPIAIAIILLTVNKVFFISFIGKLVHDHFQKCLFIQKPFFSKFSFGIFEIFDLQKVDC